MWGVLGAAVLAVAGVTGSYLYVRSYLKSDSFLSMLRQSAIDDMNVDDARIEPLEWDGSGIRCGGVTMQGHEFLTSLQARSIDGLQMSGRMKLRHHHSKGDSKPCPKRLYS